MQLREETAQDWWEVEALYDLCFAPGRELLSSYRLREDVAPIGPLCLVARDEGGTLGGAIRFWPVRIGPVRIGPGSDGPGSDGPGSDGAGADAPQALLLGPVAVHPTRQGEGLGALLLQDSLARARALGWARVLLVGDAPYYGRFGFERLDGVQMPPPTNPERVLGLELAPGAWDGVTGEVCAAR